MMNLNVLFVSANLTGNDTLRQIAISHADKTMVNQIRDDGGCNASLNESLFKYCIVQAHRFMLWNTMKKQAKSWAEGPRKDIPTIGVYSNIRPLTSALRSENPLQYMVKRTGLGNLWLRAE